MKILLKDNKDRKWKVVESSEYKEEKELKDLLVASPSLIPIDEIREDGSPLVIAVPEFGLPGSGNTDILCFSARGDIAIVECKLAANSEIKRKVIGQILEYGAYLWGMSYENLDSKLSEICNKNLTGLIEDLVGDPDWDEGEFRNNVTDSLKNGNFILIIAVDEMNEELSKTVKFINGCGEPNFSFCALEMRQFKDSDNKMLIPHLYGISNKEKQIAGSGRKKWTDEEFFITIKKQLKTEIVNIIEDLYKWSKSKANSVTFGTGRDTGSFTFYYYIVNKPRAIFTISTKGNIALAYHGLQGRIDNKKYIEFHSIIRGIEVFKNIPENMTNWYSSSIEEDFYNKPDTLRDFKNAVERLKELIK